MHRYTHISMYTLPCACRVWHTHAHTHASTVHYAHTHTHVYTREGCRSICSRANSAWENIPFCRIGGILMSPPPPWIPRYNMVSWCSRGIMGGLDWVSMMPRDASPSDSCTPDRCCNSSLRGLLRSLELLRETEFCIFCEANAIWLCFTIFPLI